MITVFIVKHAFRYGERHYQPGEEFEPQGQRFDGVLIKHHCRAEERDPKPTGKRRTKKEVIDDAK